jgi:hypothetical protein
MIMKTTLFSLTVAVVLLFTFCGCDERTVDVPYNPDNVSSNDADWVLAFRYETALSAGDFYRIELYSTTDKQKDIEDSIVEITVGDSLIPLYYHNYIPFFKGWMADDAHLLDEEQIIELKIDNERVIYTRVKPVNKVSAAFPAEYDYQQSLTLNWAVSSGNQYQFVRAEAWSDTEEGSNSPYSQYVKQVGASSRRHIFPANCVSPAGSLEWTTFLLIVQEINYKLVGKSAVMVYQEETQGYYGNSGKKTLHTRNGNPLIINELLGPKQANSKKYLN